jgi:hypothetical protein
MHNSIRICNMCELLKLKPSSRRNPVTVVKLCGRELSWCTKLRDAVTAIETLPTVSLWSSSTDRLLLPAASGVTHKSKLLRYFRNLLQSWETSKYYLPQQTLCHFFCRSMFFTILHLSLLTYSFTTVYMSHSKTGAKQSFLIHCYIPSYVAEYTHY